MVDLVAFLRARLVEDEQVTRAATRGAAGEWRTRDHESDYHIVTADGFVLIYDEGTPSDEEAAHIARWDPARVLAEVEAKRRIVELHQAVPAKYCTDLTHCGVCGDQGCCGHDEYYPCDTLVALALPYSDHPDYDEEWKP